MPLVALEEVLRQMRDVKEADKLVQLAVGYLVDTFDAPLVWIAFYDPPQHQLLGQGGATLLPDYPLLDRAIPLEPGQVLEQVVIEQRPVVVPDLRQETRMGVWQQQAAQLSIIGCLLYPIRYDKRCLGVLMMGSQLWGGVASDTEKALLGILTGQIASSLQAIEEKWRHRQQKHADIPLLALSTAMRTFDSMDERVRAAIAQVQAFVEVNRVSVYWYDRDDRNEFIVRWSPKIDAPRRKGKVQTSAQPSFSARDLGPTYAALLEGQLVVVGESGLSGRVALSAQVLKQLRCRSLLLAPILFQGELLGFLSVESDAARSWEEAEKSLVVGTAQLIALVAPLETLEKTIERIRSDSALTAQVAQSIYIQSNWELALQQTASQLCDRLQAQACFALQLDPASNGRYRLRPLHNPNNLSLPSELGGLEERDVEDLGKSDEAIAAETYPEDLRLLSWQEELTTAGVRSVIATSTDSLSPSSGQTSIPNGILVLVHPQPRAWKRADRRLVELVAKQIGVVLQQWQLKDRGEALDKLFRQLPAALQAIATAATPEELYNVTVQQMAHLLQVPLAGLLTWQFSQQEQNPQPPKARIQASVSRGEDFTLAARDRPIAVERDALLQWCLQSPDPLALSVADLPESTLEWLQTPQLGQLLAIAVDTSATPYLPSALLFVGARATRGWQEPERAAFELVRSTFADTLFRSISYTLLMERLCDLTQLNWYKHRHLNLLQLNLISMLHRLQKYLPPPEQRTDPNWKKIADLARGFQELVADLKPLKQEYWSPKQKTEEISSVTLMRRVLRRVDVIVKRQKLWPRVHGDASIALNAHAGRLELVLVEAIASIATRNRSDGRLDIWVQAEESWFALSLVDSGKALPQELIDSLDAARAGGSSLAWLSPLYENPLLQQSPGRELYLCQAILAQMGGSFEVYCSGDGRTVTQIRLPVADSGDTGLKTISSP